MTVSPRAGAAAVAVLAVVTCWLFLPVVLGAVTGAPRFFEWDVPEQYWPDQVYLCRSLHDGDLPLWNPHDRAGYPYFADPQAATWHPWSWVVCGLGGASPGPGWMTARVVLSFFAAGLFGLPVLLRLRQHNDERCGAEPLPVHGQCVGDRGGLAELDVRNTLRLPRVPVRNHLDVPHLACLGEMLDQHRWRAVPR